LPTCGRLELGPLLRCAVDFDQHYQDRQKDTEEKPVHVLEEINGGRHDFMEGMRLTVTL